VWFESDPSVRKGWTLANRVARSRVRSLDPNEGRLGDRYGLLGDRGRATDEPSALQSLEKAWLLRALFSDALNSALHPGVPTGAAYKISQVPEEPDRLVVVGRLLVAINADCI
jgi:hypothetical protein